MPEDELRESITLTAAISRGEPPYLQIARHYREQIEQGKLQSGASLPSVREMAEIWGVAHTTAARTLKALQDQGLVASTPGFGTVVAAGERQIRTETAEMAVGELLRWADAVEARASDASYTQSEEVTTVLLEEARLLRARAAELRGES